MHTNTKIQYLVKRAEELANRREKKDIRPGWLTDFIQTTADLFDPTTETARVGFDCRYEIDRWDIMFYLGDAEILGGMHDGQRERIAFDFDFKQLIDQFEIVDSLRYQTLQEEEQQSPQECTLIQVTGTLHQQQADRPVTVSILSRPPQTVGPGVRVLPNGEIELV